MRAASSKSFNSSGGTGFGTWKSKPASGERQRAWVGGYTKKDGTRVEGHYRATPGNA